MTWRTVAVLFLAGGCFCSCLGWHAGSLATGYCARTRRAGFPQLVISCTFVADCPRQPFSPLSIIDAEFGPLAADFHLSPKHVAILRRYVHATIQFYCMRDGVPFPYTPETLERARGHVIENIRRRMPPVMFLADRAFRRPLFYPAAYADLLPFLLSETSDAVFLDCAYFSRSMHPHASYCATASDLVALCAGVADDGGVASCETADTLRVDFHVYGRPCRVVFVRAEWSNEEAISRALPLGAGAYYALEMRLATDQSPVHLPAFERLAPDAVLLRTDSHTGTRSLANAYRRSQVTRLAGSLVTYGWWVRRDRAN
jgi:hypothetical protein